MQRLGDTEKVVSWKSKGLLTEKHTTSTVTHNYIFCTNSSESLVNKYIYLVSTEKHTTSTITHNTFFLSIRRYQSSNFYLIFKARRLN